MKRFLPFVLAASLASAAAASLPDQLRHCRGLADPAARLQCYDALSVDSVTGAIKSPSASTAAAMPAVPAARSGAAAQVLPAEQFGKPAVEAQIEAIESTIPGVFEGWEPNGVITLANGQVWRIVDGSRGAYYLTNPKVKVRRGALGSYTLEIEGENKSPKVRRIK